MNCIHRLLSLRLALYNVYRDADYTVFLLLYTERRRKIQSGTCETKINTAIKRAINNAST